MVELEVVVELHGMELGVEKPVVSQEIHLEQDPLLHKEQPLELLLGILSGNFQVLLVFLSSAFVQVGLPKPVR